MANGKTEAGVFPRDAPRRRAVSSTSASSRFGGVKLPGRRRRQRSRRRTTREREDGRRGARRQQPNDGQGVHVRRQHEAARGEGHVGVRAAGGQHGPHGAQRLGRLGARHSTPTTASRPGKVWKAPGGKTFKLELVLIDDPIAMRDAYASGKVHIGWATLDMLPLFVEQLRKDSRTMPRVYQQIDWSNGGDGIVVPRERSRRSPTCAARPSCSRRTRRRTSSCSTR